MSDYPAFRKIPRFNREVTITEKIDGTNGLVAVRDAEGDWMDSEGDLLPGVTWLREHRLYVRAGSRNRWLTTEKDNFGFAAWVAEAADGLGFELGVGNHYGEWWGSGIQRGYGLPKGQRRFSLFNTSRFNRGAYQDLVRGLDVVPVLWQGDGSLLQDAIESSLDFLRQTGSAVVPFSNPEGIVVFHSAANSYFKVTLENDESPKGQAPR